MNPAVKKYRITEIDIYLKNICSKVAEDVNILVTPS